MGRAGSQSRGRAPKTRGGHGSIKLKRFERALERTAHAPSRRRARANVGGYLPCSIILGEAAGRRGVPRVARTPAHELAGVAGGATLIDG